MVVARNFGLEAALIENPDDRDTYFIYADWLEAHGDPRAELMHVQLRQEVAFEKWHRRLITAMLPRIEETRLGELGRRARRPGRAVRGSVRLRRGFIDRMRLCAVAEPLAPLVAELFADPSCALLRTLEIRANRMTTIVDDLAAIVDAIVRTAPASLRELGLDRDLPNLADLVAIRRLERLSIRVSSGSPLSAASLRALATVPWPSLRELSLGFGRHSVAADLAPLLDRADLELDSLWLDGDCGSAFCTELCHMIVASPLAAQLKELRLTFHGLANPHYELLLARRAHFTRLNTIHVPYPRYELRFSPPG